MNIRFRLSSVLLLAIVLITGSAYGQHIFQMQAYNSPVEVLPQDAFEAQFGDNPNIPRSDEAIIALAERLYPSLEFKAQTMAPSVILEEECGEDDVGVLFAALQNPEVSDVIRTIVNDIIAAAIPPLPKTKISASGHFKIWYTTNNVDAKHNVTKAQINKLAHLLDRYWNEYVVSFKEPKHKIVRGKKRINIKVYYISANTRGRTSSGWDHIELNSSSCVKNACKRRTTSAHELFHRVQYAYGYVSGTAKMKWIVEGTAAWSQKFTNARLRDYMGRMNTGLRSPGKALITQRSYDACHFWTYLQEKTNTSAIRQVWAKYQTNGKNAKSAVDSVTRARLKMNFNKYATKWSKANYIKDLANASKDGYHYTENRVSKTSCGVTYGPLRKVPVTTKTITPKSSFTQTGSVKPYGARYHVYTLKNTLKGLKVKFGGTGSFAVSFIGINNNRWKNITDTTKNKYTFKKTLKPGQWGKLAVIVMGTDKGGSYSLKVGEKCIAGTWTDSYDATWVLKQNGTSISGTRKAKSRPCDAIVQATGTYDEPNITFKTDKPPGCCAVRWEGIVTGCKAIRGTWKQIPGVYPCSRKGSFTMRKNDSASLQSGTAIESEEDPTCGVCSQK